MSGMSLEALNSIVGVIIRRRKTVTVGDGAVVRWWGLKSHGGIVRIGAQAIVKCRIDFDHPSGEVIIGERCYIGASHLVCHTRITIGDDVIISWGVTIVDHDSHALDWAKRKDDVENWHSMNKHWEHVPIAPVRIGNKVWIGFGASILKGVEVGEGAVIGARSVVTRDVPPYSVVVGNPARVVRRLQPTGNSAP